jgi:hypothetical protein
MLTRLTRWYQILRKSLAALIAPLTPRGQFQASKKVPGRALESSRGKGKYLPILSKSRGAQGVGSSVYSIYFDYFHNLTVGSAWVTNCDICPATLFQT